MSRNTKEKKKHACPQLSICCLQNKVLYPEEQTCRSQRPAENNALCSARGGRYYQDGRNAP